MQHPAFAAPVIRDRLLQTLPGKPLDEWARTTERESGMHTTTAGAAAVAGAGARGRWRGGEVVHECECVALLADVRVLGMCCSRECGGLRLGWQYSRVRVGDEVV